MVVDVIDAKSQAARRPFDHRLIVRETGFGMDGDRSTIGIRERFDSAGLLHTDKYS